jgi:hypothetical protein
MLVHMKDHGSVHMSKTLMPQVESFSRRHELERFNNRSFTDNSNVCLTSWFFNHEMQLVQLPTAHSIEYNLALPLITGKVASAACVG